MEPAKLRTLGLVALALAAPHGLAQSFVDGAAQIPQGAPFNNSSTENVDFADIDGDGDFDAVFADGGDHGDDRNRIWVNQGGMQEGTIGTFVDETAARFPSVNDTSHDVDFVDVDNDGDKDIFVSNSSTETIQSNRWHINQGGLQSGTPGFFVDETGTRWVNLGVNNGVTSFSSVPPWLVLPSGGFIDYSGDGVFGDLDGDGDMDLVHTSYGSAFGGGDIPTRLFLNDGAGFYEEFNPSGIPSWGNGLPALWAEGVQENNTQASNGTQADIATTGIGAELGDLDGDFDLEILLGERMGQPRFFRNNLEQNGGVLGPFRDVTYGILTSFAIGGGNDEQELGDMDNDDDLDVYGLGWAASFDDATMPNDGSSHFAAWTVLLDSASDDREGDWLDYDNDGNLDLYVANFSGQDRLYHNGGPPGFGLTNVTSTEFINENKPSLGGDSCDVDNDGDYDIMVTQDAADDLWINITQLADAHAPRVIAEQVPDQMGTSDPVPIWARVFDNTSWDVIRYYETVIEYSVNGGPTQFAPMLDAGGQNFIGVIPGGFVGMIAYSVKSTDQVGNTGISSIHSFTVEATVSYCTAGTSASGCQALLSASGTASATAPSGFTLSAVTVEGQKDGLFFFGTSGRQANPWGNSSSFQCVVPPVVRTALLTGTGTNGLCDGALSLDLNAVWTNQPAKNPGAGAVVQAQLWYRDPFNTANNQKTSLSDAIEFVAAP